ncbi:MAG TPA: hypothetical protein VIL11_07020 [Limnochordales bacterium]
MQAQEREFASLTQPEPLPLYRYPTASMRLGCSLGNFLLFARTDPESNLMGLWASEDQWYCGRLRISLRTPSGPLRPTATLLRPEAQETEYEGPGVRARKRIWVPAGTAWDRAVVWTLELEVEGDGQGPARLWVQLDAVWPPIVEQEGLRRAEPEQQEKRVRCRLERGVVVAVTQPLCGRPATEVRLLGTWGGVPEPAAHHFGEPGTTRLVYELTLPPATPTRLHWVLLTDPGGEAAAWQAWQSMPCPDGLYGDTLGYLSGRLSLPSLLTPSPAVNRGFQWAKVNTLRTQCRYPSGYGFTNDPPQDILVVRDAAWYILGNDWLTPDFSREMIELVLREGVENTGKLTEFVRCAEQPPTRNDYGLNVNDDTPLFLVAVYHHAAVTRDPQFLRRVYPHVRRAAQYLLSQMQDDLVVCTSRGTNVHGIAGWRNIIPAFTLSGAVTELNAECCAALLRCAQMARAVGAQEDAERWEQAAGRLRRAMHRELVSPRTGLYALARGLDGELLDPITADMVFPLLFDVAEPEMRQRVEQRLLSPEFWSEHGARTVGRDQPEYDPDAGSQLLGGVWPNLTAWIAYAARRSHPEVVAQALATIYRISEPDVPARWGHVVPGEFPERMDGESGISRGMALSPWMPPTYLWLAIAGLAGVEADLEGLRVAPALPPQWPWLFLTGLPYGGRRLAMVWWNGTLHTNASPQSAWPLVSYDEECSHALELLAAPATGRGPGELCPPEDPTWGVRRCPHGRVGMVALRRGEQLSVFVAREGCPEQPVEGTLEVVVRWRAQPERPLWQGRLGGGEAVRLVVGWPSGGVQEQEWLAVQQPAALPRPAA